MNDATPNRRSNRERLGADRARSWARELRLRNPFAKAILMAVANYMNEDGTAWPGIGTLSHDTDISEDVVSKRLRWLEQIGAIALSKVWVDEYGVRNTEGRGKPTSSEIRFLFAADLDAIEAAAQQGMADRPLRGAARKAHEESEQSEHDDADAADVSTRPQRVLDETESETSTETVSYQVAPDQHPPPAGTKPPPAAALSSFSEKEVNPPAPLAGGSASEAAPPEEDQMADFREAWCDPITDYPKALAVWLSLSPEEQQAAITGARGYRGYVESERVKGRPRPMKDAHRWLAGKMWTGYIDAGKKAIEIAARVEIKEGSDEWQAWTVYCWCCGGSSIASKFIVRETSAGRIVTVPRRWPPVGAGIDVPREQWVKVIEGTGQYAAWLRVLHELPNASVAVPETTIVDGKSRYVLKVPFEWPPSKADRDEQAGRRAAC